MILVLGVAAVFPVAFYYRLRSQATGEKLDRRQEGWFILLTLRPIGLVKILGVIAWVIRPEWMAWSSVELPLAARWTGVGFGVVSGACLIWVFHSLGANLTDTVVTRKHHTLVTTGPYRWVRHPFYLTFVMVVIADSSIAANWFFALTGVLCLALIVLRTAKEEENLIARFGDDYREYMRTTGRFFPRLGG